jgi:hypothetical protein
MIGSCSDSWSWIRNFLPGIHVVRTIASIIPYLNLERIWSWSIIGRRPDELLSRPNGCKLAQKLLDTVKGSNGNTRRQDGWWLICLASKRYGTSSGRMDKWAFGRDDTSSGRLAGNRLFWLAESSETLMNSGIPVKQHLYIQVILSKQNKANHKLTIWMSNSMMEIMTLRENPCCNGSRCRRRKTKKLVKIPNPISLYF